MPAPDGMRGRSYDGDMMDEGRVAERIVAGWLASEYDGRVISVVDDPEWQEREVDFLVTSPTRRTALTVEAKSDRHIANSGNVLFELARVHHTASTVAYNGWSVFSQAELLVVYCPPASSLYVMRMQHLREGLQAYCRAVRGAMRVIVTPTDTDRTTINVLIPMDYVPNIKTVEFKTKRTPPLPDGRTIRPTAFRS